MVWYKLLRAPPLTLLTNLFTRLPVQSYLPVDATHQALQAGAVAGGWQANQTRLNFVKQILAGQNPQRFVLQCSCIMKKEKVVKKTEEFVKSKLYGEGSGHDWWHTFRVWQIAKRVGEKEGADLFVVELAALLHDIADWKFQDGYDDSVGAMVAKEWLEGFNVDSETISHICKIIKGISFKGAEVKDMLESVEGEVVQDADRLDAVGAIGIARCFAYGGSKGRQIYDPDIEPTMHQTFEEYKKSASPSINHFYEKLLLLKDRMHTKTGKILADGRHKFMKAYLQEFFDEWEGKK